MTDRDKEITIAVLNGKTFRSVGKINNMSATRAQQIFHKTIGRVNRLRRAGSIKKPGVKINRKNKDTLIPLIISFKRKEEIDRDYQDNINHFIPAAVAEAKERAIELAKVTGGHTYTEKLNSKFSEMYRHHYFTEFFHEAMNRMTREAGLRSM